MQNIFGVVDERRLRIRAKATEALKSMDMSEIFEEAGVDGSSEVAGAAMKRVLAEKVADNMVRAMREAKKRKIRLDAAAILIAAR
ncbi:MAG: hypothetical protein M1504_01370 [Candidatus Marsarchaeota archaeon]|nr:hypothetical protein [Candidatus Marsarchaeota archaeon]